MWSLLLAGDTQWAKRRHTLYRNTFSVASLAWVRCTMSPAKPRQKISDNHIYHAPVPACEQPAYHHMKPTISRWYTVGQEKAYFVQMYILTRYVKVHCKYVGRQTAFIVFVTCPDALWVHCLQLAAAANFCYITPKFFLRMNLFSS